MMSVKNFVQGICKPVSITVYVGINEEYELINENTESVNRRMLDMLGDYVIEDFKAHKPDTYSIWVLMRPVSIGEIEN